MQNPSAKSQNQLLEIKTISNELEAKNFIALCVKVIGLGFHPETDFSDYMKGTSLLFEPKKANELNLLLEASIAELWTDEHNDNKVYDIIYSTLETEFKVSFQS